MNVIIKGLGVQTDDDLSFLSRDYSFNYIRKLE